MSGMRLKDARLLNHNMSQKDLAAKIGSSERSIIRWEKGETEPQRHVLVKLADALGVTTDYLMGRSDDPAPAQDIKKEVPSQTAESLKQRRIETNMVSIPVVSREWTACCGGGLSALDITTDSGDVIAIPRSILRAYDDMRPPYAIHCEGDCLESDGIHDGDLVVINPAEEPVNGGAVLCSIAGALSLKHIFFLKDDVLLKSDDGERTLTKDQQEHYDFMVCGVVVSKYSGRPKTWTL